MLLVGRDEAAAMLNMSTSTLDRLRKRGLIPVVDLPGAAPMFSSQPSLQNFGNVMDLGTVAAVISGLVLLPALYGRLKQVHRGDEKR